jgi:hypothetical protein
VGGVTAAQFASPVVQDSFKTAVGASAGVSADYVTITGYSDATTAAVESAGSAPAAVSGSPVALETRVTRRLSSGSLSVQYSITYTLPSSSTTVLDASNALIAKINAVITSGNFTSNLATAAANAGITVYWSASTVPTAVIVTPSPTAAPSAAPSVAKSSKKKSDMALIIGVAVGVGVPVLAAIVVAFYFMCKGAGSGAAVAPMVAKSSAVHMQDS